LNRKVLYTITSLLLLFILTRNGMSQNMAEIPTFGIKAGVLLSTVTGDEAIDRYAKKLGTQIGLSGAYYFSPHLSVCAELNYELKGAKFSNHDMKMHLHYVTLPLYLKFGVSSDPEIYFYGGAYGSYLLSAKTEGKYEIIIGEDYINQSINEDIYSNLTKFDVGILAGVGAQGRFNRWLDIFIDLRYTQGFFNLDNQSALYRYNFNHTEFWPEQSIDKPKNRAFMLTVGFIYFFDPR